VAEQLAREELLGEGRAVHDDERPVAARALSVQRPREDALARAVLAAEEVMDDEDVERPRLSHG
jgi:hypothetical protein